MPSLKLSNPFRRGADRPSLRERAEALKATAGRVIRRKPRPSSAEVAAAMGRPAIEPEGFADASEGRVPDASPALTTLIEAWQALAVEIEHAPDRDADDLAHRHTEMQMAICRFPAASAADLLAKVPVFRDELQDAIGGLNPDFSPEETLSGAAWLGLFRDFERLASKVAPEPGELAGDDLSKPGFILFQDTAGATRRKPVADWIAYMALRLYHVARSEEMRASNATSANGPDQDADALHDRLRRDLRIDALHDLAFRSGEVFEASREHAVGDRWRDSGATVPTAGDAASLVSDILAGWKQWAAAGGPSGTDEAEALADVIRSDLLGAADRLPATLEALPVKALALAWIMYPELWAAGQSCNDYATDGRLALDIHQAAVSAEGLAIHPDADLIALGLELDASLAREGAGDADAKAAIDLVARDEADARIEAACAETRAILERLATIPAHTAEGLRIKLRAIRHGAVDASDDAATCRVFRSLLRDAGVPEAEIGAEA